jgi:Ca2+-transporting ATPase
MGGRGTDVAREAAAVVLEDDRFETIGVAIEEGRTVFDNIRKFVFYLFSCNLAEIFVMFGTSAAGLPLPLEPIQILWLNLVTDTAPALALAIEPAAPAIMRRPPRRPTETIVSGTFLLRTAGYAALIAASSFVVVAWAHATWCRPAAP